MGSVVREAGLGPEEETSRGNNKNKKEKKQCLSYP